MRALILVDLQRDFMPGGPLGVDGAWEVVPVANQLQALSHFDIVVATQDWHPPDHESFASQHEGREPGDVIDLHGIRQTLWPDHCVQQTPGAGFVDGLETRRAVVFRKGTNRHVDSYSAFYDNHHRQSTGLASYLRKNHIEEVYVAGVATDYCVLFTALDAAREGFRTFVVQDATRAVELNPGDTERAFERMRRAGVELMGSDVLLTTGKSVGRELR